jgi:DNA-binding MarR family transcriptional regulator
MQLNNDKEMMEKAIEVMFGMKKDLTVSSRFLYVALMNIERDRVITHNELAEITGYSIPTVKNSIEELIRKKMIIKTRTQRGLFITVLSGEKKECDE